MCVGRFHRYRTMYVLYELYEYSCAYSARIRTYTLGLYTRGAYEYMYVRIHIMYV